MGLTDTAPAVDFSCVRGARGLRGFLLHAAMALGAACAVSSALAQAYPSRPIRFIVPFGVSAGDAAARLLATAMGASMGQPLVVENITGAGGLTGTTQMVRSPKDGYTISLVNNGHVINPNIYKDMPFDSIKDITPIGMIGHTPLMLVINPSVPAKDLKELIALAKAKPGTLSYGSSGNGSALHLAGVMFAKEADVNIKHIPYKAAAQMYTDLIGGHIDMSFPAASTAAAQVQSGKMRAIGVTSQVRSKAQPNVPTLAQAGLPNYNFVGWFGIAGPAGLPRPIVDRLNAELKAALALPEVQEGLAKLDVTSMGGTPEVAAQFIESELEKHTQLVKQSGATLQ